MRWIKSTKTEIIDMSYQKKKQVIELFKCCIIFQTRPESKNPRAKLIKFYVIIYIKFIEWENIFVISFKIGMSFNFIRAATFLNKGKIW